MSPKPSLRVVCIAFNPGPEVEACLASLPAAYSGPLQVVMVDNTPASTSSQGPEIARRYGAAYLARPDNPGYGKGANAGAGGLSEDYLLVANPDLVFRPGSLDELVGAAEALRGERPPNGTQRGGTRTQQEGPAGTVGNAVGSAVGSAVAGAVGSLGPRLENPDGSAYPSGRTLPSLWRGAGHALFGKIWPANPWTRAYHGRGYQASETTEVDWISGACVLVPRQAWQAVGGFSEDYFMFFEDVDLGWRLGRAGLKNYLVPAAVVMHEQGATWKKRPAAMIRAHHEAAAIFLSKYYAGWAYAPLRGLLRAGLALRLRLILALHKR